MRGAQVGIFSPDGTFTSWSWASRYKPMYLILHWQTRGPDGHYTIADLDDTELYDPHDPDQAGYEIDKIRIMRRLAYSFW